MSADLQAYLCQSGRDDVERQRGNRGRHTLAKIDRISEAIRHERYRFAPGPAGPSRPSQTAATGRPAEAATALKEVANTWTVTTGSTEGGITDCLDAASNCFR